MYSYIRIVKCFLQMCPRMTIQLTCVCKNLITNLTFKYFFFLWVVMAATVQQAVQLHNQLVLVVRQIVQLQHTQMLLGQLMLPGVLIRLLLLRLHSQLAGSRLNRQRIETRLVVEFRRFAAMAVNR